MALPFLVKTWFFSINSVPSNNGRDVLLALVNGMLGNGSWTDIAGVNATPTNNWTVSGSNDTVTSGMDGVNRWIDSGDLNWTGGGGLRSWIVLRQTSIGGGQAEILISLSGTAEETLTVTMSPSVGFGSANGGTDGTTSSVPTATDQVDIISNDNWGWNNSTFSKIIIMKSNDGFITRIAITRNGGATGWWEFTVPGGTVPGWINPWIGTIYGVASDSEPLTKSIPVTIFNSTARSQTGTPTLGNFSLFYSVEFADSIRLANVTTPNEIEDNWSAHPIGLYSNTSSLSGRHGFLSDLWWVQPSVPDGATFPPDSTYRFICIGPFVVPWNRSVPDLFA